MAFLFVVEDGSGLAAANGLCSVSFVDDYHASRGNAGWTAETSLAISAVTAVDDTLTRVGHGLAVGAGPYHVASTNAVPGGLSASTAYWIQSIPTADTFKITTAPGGAAVDITSAGSGTITLVPISVKAAAIIRASDYVESMYGLRLKGAKSKTDQAFHFPATGVYDDETGAALAGVPTRLKNAVAELALAARTLTLGGAPGVPVVSESRTRGDMTDSQTFAAPGAPGSGARYPAAERWLRPLLRPVQAVRA